MARKDTRTWTSRHRHDTRRHRTRNRSPLDEILPPFNFEDLYTYFKDLNNKRNNIPRNIWAAQTAQAASSRLNLEINQLKEGTQIVNDAITILGKIAESERQKEINAINQYKDKLKTTLKDWENAPELQQIIQELNQINLDTSDFETLKNFNINLTKAINLIKQRKNDYVARLQRIIASNQNDNFTTNILNGQQIQYRLHSDLEGLLKDATGAYVRESREAENNLSKTLRQCAEDYLFSDIRKLNKLGGGAEIAAMLAAIETDIMELAQQEFNNQQIKNNSIAEKITADIVKQIYEKYKQASEEDMTYIQKMYKNKNQNEINTIINNMKKAFGISTIDETIDQYNERRTQALANLNNSKRISLNQGAKRLQRTIAGREIFDKLLTVNISGSSQVYGTIEEGVRSVIEEGSFLTSGRTLADMISLGSLKFNSEVSLNFSALQDLGRQFTNIISDFTNKNVLEDRHKSYAEDYSKMNDALAEIIKQLKNIIIEDPDLDELFVFHESIKSYMSAEGDITSKKFKGFKGGQMQIFTAFDRLYSMANLDLGVQFLEMDAIKFIALNLSEGALGSENKEPLAKYLSIFAGMLMFDDVKNMALDMATNITNEPVQQVHVYLLNDIYVPSSVVLSNIYLQLEKGLTNINIENAAAVQITTDDIDAQIAAYKPNLYSRDKWDTYAETARKSTLVTIYFLKSYVDFLQNLIS